MLNKFYNMKDLLPYELSLLLLKKGFDNETNFMWVRSYRIKDEIIEKYPGLSDDGYYDLLKSNGGELEEEDVFGYVTETMHMRCRNTKLYFDHYSYMICSCPSISEVLKWLIADKHTYINVQPYSDENGIYFESSYSVIVDNTSVNKTYLAERFDNYEESFFKTIEEIIKNYETV